MHEFQPITIMGGMSEVPPPQFAQYPRSSVDKQKLQALADGYQGLSNAFVINICLSIGINFLWRQVDSLVAIGAGIVVIAVVVFFATLNANKKIGEGLGWSPTGPTLASVLIAANSALCCGMVGYVVVQGLALRELKKHGIKTGVFITKKSLDSQIEAL